ncbi:DNA-binding barrel domain superfamily [Sesbania bispinosa]|nr:DNA-binding barrel domain superfamily [Sesbania bispinosa]
MSSSSQGRASAVHFFKIIDENCLRSGDLRIPRRFVSNYWEGMSNPLNFLLPDGAKWEVTWEKRGDDVWLGNNWKKFASFYSLDHEHLLMFKYQRKSQFQVVICDQSGLEIGYPVFKGTFDAQEISDQSEDPKWHSSQRVQTDIVQPRRTELEIKRSHSAFDNTKPKSRGRKRNMRRSSKSEATESKKPLLNTASSSALERAKAYCTTNPSFIREMRRSHVERHIMQKEEDSATLRVSERTWDAKLHLNRCNGQITLSSGWKNFVEDNNLKLGDVCVFEQIKSEGVSFKVVIFHAREESSPPGFQAYEAGANRSKLTGVQSNFAQREGVGGIAKKFPRTNNIFDGSEFPRNNSTMSENQFTLSLKPNQLSHAIIPMKFIRKYVINEVTDVKLRVGERSWPVKLYYYSKPCYGRFSAGWSAFVRDCNLKPGDVCLFELVDEQNFVLQVSIKAC